MITDGKTKNSVSFNHPSEEEFARILDFYQIKWEYEPTTFELKWDEAGNLREAFSPDFYLPEQDLYIELTTMEQRLITKKNRKIRRLRKLYPDVNIKLLNRADFEHMMLKYGL
jgi:hypoxanthine phosphoribosyltransferase